MDITRNAVWTKDCGGKEDLDFNIISASTRYWPDYSAICSILFVGGNYYKELEYPWNEPHRAITLLESDMIWGIDKEDCQRRVREWYNANIKTAFEKALTLI